MNHDTHCDARICNRSLKGLAATSYLLESSEKRMAFTTHSQNLQVGATGEHKLNFRHGSWVSGALSSHTTEYIWLIAHAWMS